MALVDIKIISSGGLGSGIFLEKGQERQLPRVKFF